MSNDFLPVHLIQTFVAFVEATNITEAADKLGISQPAVSVHLKKLEEHLPHPVFTMQGKKKVPSAYGRSLYRSLSPVFKNLSHQLELVNSEFAETRAPWRIGYSHHDWLSLLAHSPLGQKIKFIKTSTDERLDLLESKEVDYLLCSQKISGDRFRNRRLDSLYWSILASHNWYSHDNWFNDKTWLKNTPLIYEAQSAKTAEKYLSRLQISIDQLESSIEAPSPAAAMQMIQNGLGYGFSLNPPQSSSGVMIQNLPESIFQATTVYLIHRKSHFDPEVMSLFKKK